MKILVADDDTRTLDSLDVGLRLHWDDAVIVTATTGEEATRRFFDHDPDIVLLDAALHDGSGFDVLRQIRRVSDIPVIVLADRADETDEVRAFELGADDFVVKPFGLLALIARVKASLRHVELRVPGSTFPSFTAGDLTISFDAQRVTVAGETARLTPVEYRVLYHLARNTGRLLTHEALLDRIWGGDSCHTADHLKVYISRLRSKIEHPGGPHFIENVRGLGYRFLRPPEPPAGEGRLPRALALGASGR